MTDTPTPNSTSSPAGLSPEIAAARANWIKVGNDPATFDKHMGITAPPPPALAANPTGSSAAPSWISQNDALKLGDGLLKAGVPEEKVLAALAADGHPIDSISIDVRSDQEITLDKWGIGAEHDPSEYRVDWKDAGRNLDGVDPKIVQQANERLTTFAANVGLIPQVATSTLSEMMRTYAAIQRMDEGQRADWLSDQNRVGERIAGGPEKWAEKIKFADASLARADKSYMAELRETGVLGSAAVILNLAFAEEARAFRARVLKK